MSNGNFDRLYKKVELKDAEEALANYKKAFAQSNLEIKDYEFLNRAIGDTERRLARAKQALTEWWN